MLEKTFSNDELDIELTSNIDNKQNIWFKGKDIAQVLGYSDTDQALRKRVSEEYKKKHLLRHPVESTHCSLAIFINEPGFYELVFGSKLETAKKLKQWVFKKVLPSIRKYGQYKLFDNPNNQMFKVENETDLYTKVVDLIRKYYPYGIILAGLGQLQDTSTYKKNPIMEKGI